MARNKEIIRKRFARAAATYDDQAVIQLKVADRLLTLLEQHAILPPKKVLEIGCCTGLLTGRLVEHYHGLAKLYVNDLVPEFKKVVAARIPGNVDFEFLEGDIESVPLPDDLDLVISSSTFHWLEDLSSLFARLADHMSPEGTLAFSMYSRNNLWELRETTGIGLHYYGPDELKELTARYFQILALEEEFITFKFRDPLDILRHMRETGVNALDGGIWNRSRLNDFTKQYRARFSDHDHIRLTYHPVYCVARKA